MIEIREKIERFLSVCDELVSGKYFDADKKISELLKIVAESQELTDLFSAVTERFDYLEAKTAYLRYPASLGVDYGAAYLPTERGEVLAFVFCLLVELDGGELKLNEFLLRYFYEDGSYTASYALFSDRMMRPFRDIVKNCFSYLGIDDKSKEEREITLINCLLDEKRELARYGLSEKDKSNAELLLSQALVCAEKSEGMQARAILLGYSYLLRANGVEEKNEELFSFLL